MSIKGRKRAGLLSLKERNIRSEVASDVGFLGKFELERRQTFYVQTLEFVHTSYPTFSPPNMMVLQAH